MSRGYGRFQRAILDWIAANDGAARLVWGFASDATEYRAAARAARQLARAGRVDTFHARDDAEVVRLVVCGPGKLAADGETIASRGLKRDRYGLWEGSLGSDARLADRNRMAVWRSRRTARPMHGANIDGHLVLSQFPFVVYSPSYHLISEHFRRRCALEAARRAPADGGDVCVYAWHETKWHHITLPVTPL